MLRQKLSRFLYGRYGMDKMGTVLSVIAIVLWLVSALLRRLVRVSLVISLLALVLYAYVLFRALSRNIVKRSAENRAFCRLTAPIGSFFTLQRDRIRDRRHHVYRRCPRCRAILRLPRRAGKHDVRCPKCQNGFSVRIFGKK